MSRGETVDPAALADAVRHATRRSIARQLECGIDVGNDGEQPRESFFTYVRYRMSGFGGESRRPAVQDVVAFPTFAELFQPRAQKSLLTSPPRAIGEVRYVNRAPLDAELGDYETALAQQPGRFLESFWTAPSPGIIACAMQNDYYGSLDEYVNAVADALRTEYEAIVARGMVLQIDGPDLAMERHRLFADRPLAEFLDFVDVTVSALNRALRNVPPDRVRLHVCWGNYEGPHIFDVPLEDLAQHLYAARVGGLVLSMANPRHAHEHRILAKQSAAARLGDRGRSHRYHHELRRASRGDRRAHRAGGASGRRSASRPRRHRLRLRHLYGTGQGCRGGCVGEAARTARGRGDRYPQAPLAR